MVLFMNVSLSGSLGKMFSFPESRAQPLLPEEESYSILFKFVSHAAAVLISII